MANKSTAITFLIDLIEPSTSMKSEKLFSFTRLHVLHVSHANPSWSQSKLCASKIAESSLPVPLSPKNKYAWAKFLLVNAFSNIL